MSKQDKFFLSVITLLLIGLIVISPFLPDTRPGTIRKELKKQGCNVENVDFEYIADGDRLNEYIYQSSIPIYYNGEYVNQWSIYSFSLTPTSVYRYHFVNPYPPLSEPITINITFSASEYKSIVDSASGQQIEEYIKKVVIDSME